MTIVTSGIVRLYHLTLPVRARHLNRSSLMPVRDREGDPAGSDDLPGPEPLNEDEDEEEDNPSECT